MLQCTKSVLVFQIALIAANSWVGVQSAINDFNDAAEFVATFKSMTDASADVLDKISNIGNGAFTLLKFAGPIGQMVHIGLSIGLKQQDSPELRAIQALQRQITEQFEALSRKIDDSIVRQEYRDSMTDYQKTVSYNIRKLEKLMEDGVKAPTVRSLEKIRNKCEYSEQSPLDLLEWLNEIVNINCRLPSVKEAKTYANVTRMLSKIEEKINMETTAGITNSTSYKSWTSNVLVRLMEMPSKMADKHINYLENTLNNGVLNFTEADSLLGISQRLVKLFSRNPMFGFFHAEIHRTANDPDIGCFLSTVSSRYQKRRVPILEHSNFVITDAVRLQLLGIMCEGFVANEIDEYHHLQLGRYDKLTKEIAQALSKWVNADLDLAWPDLIVSEAILMMKKQKGDGEVIEEGQFQNLATKIQTIANERGHSNFLHQVIVSRPWDDDLYFVMKCVGDFCTRIYKKHGTNVVISRLDENEVNIIGRLELSRRQIQQHRSSLQASIKNRLYELGGKCDLNLMLKKSNIGAPFSFGNYLFGRHFWRTFLFLHNRKFFSKACTIPTGLAGVVMEGMNAYDDETVVMDNPFFTDANSYKLILLL